MSFNFDSGNLGSFKAKSPTGKKGSNSREDFSDRINANKPEAKERVHKYKKQEQQKVVTNDDKDKD